MLEIRVLGTLEVIRDGTNATLPRSRKTRALLGYLTLTRRPQRRQELCEMFWDVPDDPRAALRWSLSRIRPLVDEPAVTRLVADRHSVELRTAAQDVDLFTAQNLADDRAAATANLVRAAATFRGPLLADLDLPEIGGFHTWLLGMREDATRLRARILRALSERLAAIPEAALPHVRDLVAIDSFDEDAWALLITTLANAGRRGEIAQQYQAGQRALREVGGGSGPLLRAWRATQASNGGAVTASAPAQALGPSIVVLPFANLSNDPEQQYFADGITGNLTTELSRMPDLVVISRNTAFTYRDKLIDTRQIGRELGVRYVLEGAVQRSGTKLRVSVQLIDTQTDANLWAERFDGNASNLLALQDEITNRIAAALDLELVEAEASRPIDNPDTRDYILRGRAVRLQPPSGKNRAEAIELFECALALDAQSAAAQSWLAIALTARALDFMADAAAADIARAEELADKALTTMPRSGIPHFAKAQVLRAQYRFAEAIPEYETVTQLARNWAHTYSHLGWCKFMTGEVAALIPAQEQTIRLSPRDPQIGLFYGRIGTAHLLQSHTDQAIAWYERARNASPAHPEIRTFLAASYALNGDMERAADELAEARRLIGDDRYCSISSFRSVTSWGVPKIRELVERTYFAGLRLVGVPDRAVY